MISILPLIYISFNLFSRLLATIFNASNSVCFNVTITFNSFFFVLGIMVIIALPVVVVVVVVFVLSLSLFENGFIILLLQVHVLECWECWICRLDCFKIYQVNKSWSKREIEWMIKNINRLGKEENWFIKSSSEEEKRKMWMIKRERERERERERD